MPAFLLLIPPILLISPFPNPCIHRIPKYPPFTAYIANLPYDVDEGQVQEVFERARLKVRIFTGWGIVFLLEGELYFYFRGICTFTEGVIVFFLLEGDFYFYWKRIFISTGGGFVFLLEGDLYFYWRGICISTEGGIVFLQRGICISPPARSSKSV